MKKHLTLIFFLCTYFLTNAQTVSITSSASGSICAGTSVTFTATTTGFTNPYYQWYLNGSMISGATSSTYTTTSLNNNDAIKVSVNEGPVGSITTSGLILNLDATNPSSYAGTGTSWNNLVTGNAVSNFTLSSSYASFSTDNGGVIRFGSNGSGGGTTGGSASSSTGFSNLSAYTVEVWVKAAGTRGDYNPTIAGNTNYVPSFFSEKVSGGTVNMVLSYNARGWGGIDNNSYRYAANMGGWQTPAHPTTNYSSDLNNWVQILATYNGSTLTLYRNGVSIGSSTTNYNLRQTSTGYWIAHRWDMTDGVYGDYSKVMMYNRALSTAEVSANYSAFNDRFLGSGVSSSTITTTVTPGPTAPSITVVGDGCINKTTLTTTSGLSSYTWYKDNVAIAGATTTTYSPTAAGDYKVVVSNGTCSTTSAVTAIYTCGVSADGKMVSVANPGSLLSMEGGANFGTGIDNVGKILNTTGLTTTTGTIGATTAVINGIISATNAVTSSIGVIYSTDANFGTSSSSTIQSNVVAGAYTTTITGLSSSTNYYAKSFVVNKAGTSFGPVVSFTTPAAYVAPIITTTGLVLNLDAAHPDSYAGSGTAWTDVSNNNNSVTLPSVIASSYSATTGGGSFTFNSNNAINKFSSTSINNWNINTTNAISVETWIKYTSNGGLQFYFQDDAINYRFGFDQAAHFYYDLGAHSDRNPSTATLTANTWHHLVITAGKETANGNRVKSRFYIDGAEVYSYDEGISSLPNITTPYHIGDDPYHYYPLNGNIGVIRVYNTALSQAEITLNFNAQKARFGL